MPENKKNWQNEIDASRNDKAEWRYIFNNSTDNDPQKENGQDRTDGKPETIVSVLCGIFSKPSG